MPWYVTVVELLFITLFARQILKTVLATWMYFTSDAPFESTQSAVFKRARSKIALGKNDVCIDLGSGSGKSSLAIAKYFDCKVLGIEKNSLLVTLARLRAMMNMRGVRTSFVQQDVLALDLSTAAAVYLYMSPYANKRLLPKFAKELQNGTVVLAYRWPLQAVFLKELHAIAGKHTLYIYEKA